MIDLFSEAAYDPGGKVSVQIPLGVRGCAEFSPCGRYRYLLTRAWSESAMVEGVHNAPWVLWIGCNPSTATAYADDPTMIRIRGFTERLGYHAYMMMNVMDWRATDPKKLLDVEAPCSSGNLERIADFARAADLVIAAWGTTHRRVSRYTENVDKMLESMGADVWCLGTNKDESPKHPLYVKGDTPLVRYRP